jgi:hypothetical protein
MDKFAEKALKMLEDMKLKSLLNSKEKTDRYIKARKSGYSEHFALIFALQKDQNAVNTLNKKIAV